MKFPDLLSIMTTGDKDGFVPGLIDLVKGNTDKNILSFDEKRERGRVARDVLMDYKKARSINDNDQI